MIVPRFDLSLDAGLLAQVLVRALSGRAHEPESALRRFEEAFATFLGVKHAIFVASARTGLYLLLRGADDLRRAARAAGAADERTHVIVPAWTHTSVPAVVRGGGWTPWFVDCELETQNVALSQVPEEAWASSWAVIPTHLYGRPLDVQAWVDAAHARGLLVIEDCAQSTGALLRQRRVGSFADASYFSFALTKSFSTLGAGLVATNDDKLAAAVRARVAGGPGPSLGLLKAAGMGLAFKLATRPAMFGLTVLPAIRAGWALAGKDMLHEAFDEGTEFDPPATVRPPFAAQAMVGLSVLAGIDAANRQRAAVGRRLHELLEGILGVGLSTWLDDSSPIFATFMIRVEQRQRFMRELLARGVDTSPGYMKACHRLDWGAPVGLPAGSCPNAELLEATQVHLPVYPRLNEAEIVHIATSVREVATLLGVGAPQPPQAVTR